MKVILTGITGNLGYEVAIELMRRGVEVVPLVRGSLPHGLSRDPARVIVGDLADGPEINFLGNVDAIVHCAGVVRFQEANGVNEKMMHKVLKLARGLKTPVYYASTAFLYRPPHTAFVPRNSYEEDKWRAEQALITSKIPYAIFLPSILTGSSANGAIRNFSGYYLVAQAFRSAIERSTVPVRFPRLSGTTNVVPVDQAAQSIVSVVQKSGSGMFYITNPAPSTFVWFLTETLTHFGLDDRLQFIDCSFKDFEKLPLTDTERELVQFGKNFHPYWALDYPFPPSLCTENLVDHNYVRRILNYYQKVVPKAAITQ